MEIAKVKEAQLSYLVNDSFWVPKDQNNRHYQQIQKWIAEGGVVEKEDLLAKAKLKKIAEIKSIRDQKTLNQSLILKPFYLMTKAIKPHNNLVLFFTPIAIKPIQHPILIQ